MNGNFEINTELALFDYLRMVNEIAYGFINSEDGTYQPHIGNLNAMRLFYNHCVIKGKFDEQYNHDIIDADSMEEIVADKDFIDVFNEGIKFEGVLRYDFANAYKDAIAIVDVKKTSFGSAVNIVGSIIDKLIDSVSSFLTEENISTISQIAKDMSDGKISAESIVGAYADKLASISE